MIKSGVAKTDDGNQAASEPSKGWPFRLPNILQPKNRLTPLIGAETIIAERYQILSTIARGGMGVVYKAKHLALNRLVAVKVLPVAADDLASYQRFEHEAHSVARLNHPNIVSVYDYGQMDDGSPFLVMEYIEGLSLSKLLRQDGCLEPGRAAYLISQICDGLNCAHEQSLIHRDLKPANILLAKIGGNEIAKLIDFGLAKRFVENQQMTETGALLGTPIYMSPEQCRGENTDARSDIYSLGCVLFEMVTGQPPLKGDSHISTVFKHLNEVPNFEHPSLDPQLKLILAKCLHKLPENRFSSVIELKQALSVVADVQVTSKQMAALEAGAVASSTAPGSSKIAIDSSRNVLSEAEDGFDLSELVPSKERTLVMRSPRPHSGSPLYVAVSSISLVSLAVTIMLLSASAGFRASILPAMESINKESAFHLAVDIADTYMNSGKVSNAREMYERARRLANYRTDFAPARIAHVHAALGKLYQSDWGGLQRALHSSSQARTIFEQFKQTDSPEYAQAIADIAVVQAQQGDLQNAIHNCDEAIDAFRKLPADQHVSTSLLYCNQLKNQLSARLSAERKHDSVPGTAEDSKHTEQRKGIRSRNKSVVVPPPRVVPAVAHSTTLPPIAPQFMPRSSSEFSGDGAFDGTLNQPPVSAPDRNVRRSYRQNRVVRWNQVHSYKPKPKKENKFIRTIKKAWEKVRSL